MTNDVGYLGGSIVLPEPGATIAFIEATFAATRKRALTLALEWRRRAHSRNPTRYAARLQRLRGRHHRSLGSISAGGVQAGTEYVAGLLASQLTAPDIEGRMPARPTKAAVERLIPTPRPGAVAGAIQWTIPNGDHPIELYTGGGMIHLTASHPPGKDWVVWNHPAMILVATILNAITWTPETGGLVHELEPDTFENRGVIREWPPRPE